MVKIDKQKTRASKDLGARPSTQIKNLSALVEEILSRGVEEVIDKEHLKSKLLSGKTLRVKLGIDPTSPNLHLGRVIPLLKLRDFQILGHKVVLIIGDFTGIIGDSSDKDSERPMLDVKTIKVNMKTYVRQAAKILDIKKCEIKYNSAWLKKLGFAEIGKMANAFGLHEFEARENIRGRLRAGKRVSLRELIYPLMQGYDSVAIKSDVELGGTDQRFNLLSGRSIQPLYSQESQDIMMNPLIEGLDGRKMSSSWGNTINLTDSSTDMFGKIMSLKDELIEKYFVLATRVPLVEIEEVKKMANPKDQKERLAFEVVKMYHGQKEAKKAQEDFGRTFSKKEWPADTKKMKLDQMPILDLLVSGGLAESKSEARRLMEQGAVKINGFVEKDWQKVIKPTTGMKIQVGPRRFLELL